MKTGSRKWTTANEISIIPSKYFRVLLNAYSSPSKPFVKAVAHFSVKFQNINRWFFFLALNAGQKADNIHRAIECACS